MFRCIWRTGLIFGILLSLQSSEAQAQGCCSPGTPSFGALERGSLSPKQLVAGLYHQYNALKRTYRSTSPVDDPLGRRGSVRRTALGISYGFTGRISAHLILNYVDKERKLSLIGLDGRKRSYVLRGGGIGDAMLLGKFTLIPLNIASQRELSLGVGLEVPIGDYRQESDGVRLSIDLQPGSGAWKGVLWGYLYQGFLPSRLSIHGSGIYRFSGENPDGYRLGDEFLSTTGISYRILNALGLSAQVRVRRASEDHFRGMALPSTGGYWIYFVPGVNFEALGGFSLRVSGEAPLFMKVNGTQLAPRFGLTLTLNYRLGPGF